MKMGAFSPTGAPSTRTPLVVENQLTTAAFKTRFGFAAWRELRAITADRTPEHRCEPAK
jgi:hypothetical protein